MYQSGAKRVGRSFVVYAVQRAGQGRKMGCSVSRKVGGAVVRNRVKRYIREVYRTHRRSIPDDVFLVIVARPGSAGLSYHDCESEMRRLLPKGDEAGG